MAGKGSAQRKVNRKSFDENYDIIFKKNSMNSIVQKQIQQQQKDFPELISNTIKSK